MAIDTGKNSYTMLFAVAMVVVVGALLAGISSILKPRITVNKIIEKQQNILFAMGITNSKDPTAFVAPEKADALFRKYIGDQQYIVTEAKAFKTKEAFSIEVKQENDKWKADPNYSRKMPLFVGNKSGKKFYILPMRGNGLWDAIWGYVALDKNFNTIEGAYFDHKGETPGLGANIKEAFFRDDFRGEKIYDASGRFKGVTVKKGNADPKNERKNDNAVDAIAGATITGDGVTAMVKKGIKMYLPYFKTLN